ncbi:MAG: methyltransferase domain-containing protein [Verrucomicrobiales bacterium]|nr:methyltransferase domain-containing protein [Verrucomicrobiales bacterium]
MDDAIKEGAYARKQVGSRSRLISWSHGARFRIGLELSEGFAGKRVLDYGCGDGMYLALLMGSGSPPSKAVGAEVAKDLIESNRRRFGGVPGLEFCTTESLRGAGVAGGFDAVVCMEVLEHLPDLDAYLDEFDRLLAPGGTLLISVPVETGLSTVIKQAVRTINGWRGVGDYPGTTPYTWLELWKAVWAGETQHIERPLHQSAYGTRLHDHKGFNWKLLRAKMRRRFAVGEVRTSPVPWLPPFVASQVWIPAVKRR